MDVSSLWIFDFSSILIIGHYGPLPNIVYSTRFSDIPTMSFHFCGSEKVFVLGKCLPYQYPGQSSIVEKWPRKVL